VSAHLFLIEVPLLSLIVREGTYLADLDQCLGNDRVEALGNVMILLDDAADEIRLVRQPLEE